MLKRFSGLLLLLAGHLAAQVNEGRPLTLDEAIELAMANNPQLRAAAAGREAAVAGTITARAYPNPEFNVLSGNQRARIFPSDVPGTLHHMSFVQQIEMPKVRRTRMEVAALRRESSDYSVAETRLAVRGAVKQAFYQVLRRRGEIDLTRENLRLIEDLRRRIQVQVNVGEAARLELTRADAEVATARTLVRASELRLVAATSALRALLAVPPTMPLNPTGTLAPLSPIPSLDEVRAEVLSRHPSIAFAQTEVRRLQARVQAEQALRTPQPALRAEYERQPDLAFFRVGVSLPIPLLNRREGPIQEAAAELAQARAMADVRRLELTAALERAYGQFEIATQQVASFELGVLKEAEAALQAAEAAFKFGERGIIEVLDAQRVLRSVRMDYLNAQFDRQAALIELEQLRAAGLETNP